VHFTSTDGRAVLPGNSTLTNGAGTFSATLTTAGGQTITATDTVTGSITGTSGTVTVGAGPATYFAVSTPGLATLNSTFPFTVTALDAFNNTAISYAGTVRFTSTDSLAILPGNVALTNGTGTFSATLETVGSQTITATDNANPAIVGTSPTVAAVLSQNQIQIPSIVNSGDYAQASGAPNTIVSAFGTFPGCTSAGQVTVDGAAVTALYWSPTQLNFVLPGTVANGNLTISCAGLTSTASLPTAPVDPAIFTADMSGVGQAAVVNQDGGVNTPSPAGDYISVYVTGFGAFSPPSPDHLRRLAATVTAKVGGLPATILYAGEAPGYTDGLQQINLVIPSNAPSGSAVTLLLTVDGVNTQPKVTVVIP
jgi:uncharacterized protein (TIGR03437 family)